MSLTGFKHRAIAKIPQWANDLNNYYWRVRVEGRNAAKRRRYYRYIRKEKLRLIESGICPDEIEAVCKYLVSLKEVNARRLDQQMMEETKQLMLPF